MAKLENSTFCLYQKGHQCLAFEKQKTSIDIYDRLICHGLIQRIVVCQQLKVMSI